MWGFNAPGRRVHARLTLGVAVLLLGACTANGSRATTAPPKSVSAGLTSSSSPAAGYGAGCTSVEVRHLVERFVLAFNTGDRAMLQRLWARSTAGFEWYSTDAPGQRIGSASRSRASLDGYFADRHAHRETLRVTSFQFNGNGADYGNFHYTLIRRAADLPPTAYVGKGAALCATAPPTIGVWSMATDAQAAPSRE